MFLKRDLMKTNKYHMIKNQLKKSQGKDFQSLPCFPYNLSQTNPFYTTIHIAKIENLIKSFEFERC